MKIVETKCPLCGSKYDYTVIYKSNFSLSDLNPKVFSARRLPDLIHYQIVRCDNDNLVRSNPVCNNLSIEALYKKSEFNYAEQVENITISYLSVLNEVLPKFSKDAKILEIGCGNGFILKALLDKGYNNLYGVELSLEAVLNADERIKDRITVDILRDGLYKNESFDLIFFFQTFDHIYDPDIFLGICYDLLKSEGMILALNHDVGSLSAKILRDKSPIIDIEHIYLYSKETIGKIFSKAGFEPMKIFSPKNVISIKYLIWLLPLSKRIKLKLFNLSGRYFDFLLKQRLHILLGNLCIIARKPPKGKAVSSRLIY